MVPTDGLRAHLTPVLVLLLTFAENNCVCDAAKETDVGVRATETGGSREMMALADLVESTALVAMIVTFCAVVMVDGAEYKPFEIVPTAGLSVQVTDALVLLLTVAVNC